MMRQKEPEPLIDRYRELLSAFAAHEVAEKLRVIEDSYRYGVAGDSRVSILEGELREVRRRADERRRTGQRPPTELLLLTVGYSPEPLLLALAQHAPETVELLLEQGLSKDYLDSLEELWNAFHEILEVPEYGDVSVGKTIVRDSPAELFQTVRRIVERHEECRGGVVLDITGAKKSMIAGAFLAAGFLDVETSYVDFASYHPLLRRPDPGSCVPRILSHPYQLFRLRDEDRLQEAFDGRRYEEAQQIACELCEMVERPEVRQFLGELETVRRSAELRALADVAQAYALWSEGFFRDADDKLLHVQGIPRPLTVQLLGRVWPRRSDERPEIVASLAEDKVFADPATGLAYFVDVLVWNSEEAIVDRPRACFLRLYGAVEALFFFAFHVFVGRKRRALRLEYDRPEKLAELKARFPKDREGRPVDWEAEVHCAAIEHHRRSSFAAVRVLARPSGRIQPSIDLGWLLGHDVAAAARPLLPELRACLENKPLSRGLYNRLVDSGKGGLGRFTDLRHKATHWLAPVPVGLAREMRRFLAFALGEIVPLVAADLGGDESARGLADWQERLLAATGAEEAAGCTPLRYRQLRAILASSAADGGPRSGQELSGQGR